MNGYLSPGRQLEFETSAVSLGKEPDDFTLHFNPDLKYVWPDCGVYLIHFDSPVKGCKHYIGYAPNIQERWAKHLKGQGSQLTRLAIKNAVKMHLVRVWLRVSPTFEQAAKRKKNLKRLCFRCNFGQPEAHNESRGTAG